MGRKKFMRIFIPNLVELIKNVTIMLKTSNEVKWTKEKK